MDLVIDVSAVDSLFESETVKEPLEAKDDRRPSPLAGVEISVKAFFRERRGEILIFGGDSDWLERWKSGRRDDMNFMMIAKQGTALYYLWRRNHITECYQRGSSLSDDRNWLVLVWYY